jgi:TetR/AcrR family transcriptional regulator, transcriptional repressor for nem operon
MARPGKKEDLVEAGLDLVHRRGFSATSVADIAEAAGAPKGSFYSHFKSKDDFGSAVLDRYFAEVRAALEETLQSGRKPALARLRAYFVRLRKYVARDGYARGCLIGNISAEVSAVSEATREQLAQRIADWTAGLAACLEDGQRDGSVRIDVAADDLAVLLLDAWQGALLRAKVERGPAALNNFIDILLPRLAEKPSRR